MGIMKNKMTESSDEECAAEVYFEKTYEDFWYLSVGRGDRVLRVSMKSPLRKPMRNVGSSRLGFLLRASGVPSTPHWDCAMWYHMTFCVTLPNPNGGYWKHPVPAIGSPRDIPGESRGSIIIG